MEAACADAIQTFRQPKLENAVRTFLGAPAHGEAWLRYEFETATGSPIFHFTYPRALPSAVAYIAHEVKVDCGSLTDQRPTGRHPAQVVGGFKPPRLSFEIGRSAKMDNRFPDHFSYQKHIIASIAQIELICVGCSVCYTR
jgi:hypothetical protein